MADEQSIHEISPEDTRHIYEKKRVIVPTITAIILLIFGIIVSIKSMYYKSTDDAFVEGQKRWFAFRNWSKILWG